MAHNFTNNIFDPVTHQLLFTKCTHCDGRGDDDAVRTAPCPNAPTGATGAGASAGSRVVDVNSSIVVCRTLLESQMKNYIADHVKYVNNTKGAKCTATLNSKTTVSDALDHMQCCPGQLEAWRLFKKNSKLCTSAPGKIVYASLSESIHTASATENQVHIPEALEPIPKRFLIRLFQALQYIVRIVDPVGKLRDPVADELESPQPTPEKRKRKRADSDSSTEHTKKKKKKTHHKANKKKTSKNSDK